MMNLPNSSGEIEYASDGGGEDIILQDVAAAMPNSKTKDKAQIKQIKEHTYCVDCENSSSLAMCLDDDDDEGTLGDDEYEDSSDSGTLVLRNTVAMEHDPGDRKTKTTRDSSCQNCFQWRMDHYLSAPPEWLKTYGEGTVDDRIDPKQVVNVMFEGQDPDDGIVWDDDFKEMTVDNDDDPVEMMKDMEHID